MHLKHIVVTNDFSLNARHAIDRAALLAAEHSACLRLLNSRGTRPASHAASFIDYSETEVRRRFGVSLQVTELSTATPEVIAGHTQQADLIVMSEPEQSGFSRLVRGSLAERLLRVCSRPVLSVKSEVRHPYRKILAAVDLSPNAGLMVDVAVSLRPIAQVQVFHAIRPFHANPLRDAEVPQSIMSAYLKRRYQDALGQLSQLLASARDPERIQIAVSDGEPSRRTVVQITRESAELVIVGKHRRSHLADLVRGCVADGLLAWCPGDVLLVPLGSLTSAVQPSLALTPDLPA